MVAVKAPDVERALRRFDPRATPVLLVFGPDAGLVAERARALAEGAVDDPADPFQLIRLDGDAIAADPGRLADEAGTIGLFGARRAIWVKPTSRNIAAAVEAALAGALADTTIVIEAGDLAKSSPLRLVCERSPRCLAVPCYADDERDLAGVVDDALRGTGLRMGREARAALLASLGGDRLATRAELAKITLYAHGQDEITVDDIDAVISDVSALAIDSVVDGAFEGHYERVDDAYRRLAAEGASPSTILGAALRHALALLGAAADVAAGRGAREAADGWRGLHFRRKDAIRRQLGLWRPAALTTIVAALQGAVLVSRRAPDLAAAVAGRTLLDIASEARRAAKAARS
jgi:DNA polymerase-3 subunit delta